MSPARFPKRRRWLPTVAQLAAFATALGAAGWAAPVAAQTASESTRGVFEGTRVEVEPRGARFTRVDVDNRLGSVRIEGYDGSKVIVSAVKRALDSATLDRLKVTIVSDPNGPVGITTRIDTGANARPIAKGSARIDLVIRAPRGAAVSGRVWNDRLEVAGMDNGAKLTAHDGDIAVKNVSGNVVTESTAGKQHIVEVYGAVDAQAVAGDVELVIVRGRKLYARAHDGNIAGRQLRVREMSLRTTTGDIRLEGFAVAGGRYRIASYRGNIDVKLRQGAALSISAKSRDGRITLPSKLRARTDDRGALVGTLPSSLPGNNDEPVAVVELSSRVGRIQFAVIE